MTFRDRAKLDPSQVRDVRGRRRVGGAGMAIGGVGGIGGIIILAAFLLLGGNPGDAGLGSLEDQTVGTGAESDIDTECRTGADANEREDCRIVGYVNSVQEYWTDTFAAAGEDYQPAVTVFFTDQIDTACGDATSAVGPFYCPTNQTVYIDLGFYDELETQFGAEGGPLAEAYVIAHEYGHHVQNLTGILGRDSGGTGPESDAVRIELQADCFAGVWAGHAVETGYLEPLTREQIAQALDAASVIGDDRIQEQSGGRVNPETWTHGSSEQRQNWFSAGLEAADPAECDTFEGTS